jgi:hypothetical protein
MARSAVGVHGVLSAADELPAVPSMSSPWSKPRLRDHDTGLIGVRSTVITYLLWSVLSSTSVRYGDTISYYYGRSSCKVARSMNYNWAS